MMTQERNKCVQCGYYLVYSPSIQKLACNACGYESVVGAEDFAGVSKPDCRATLRCKNCSAEFTSGDKNFLGCCPYCSSPNSFKFIADSLFKPDKIVPMRISSQDAFSAIEKWAVDLRTSETFIQALKNSSQFEGCYIPFRAVNISCDFTYQAINAGKTAYPVKYEKNDRKYSLRIFEIKSVFKFVKGRGTATIESDLVKMVTNSTNPQISYIEFEKYKSLLRSYKPEYLLGFIALIPDASEEKVLSICRERLLNFITNATSYYSNFKLDANYHESQSQSIMLPSWVCHLSYDGVSYSIIVNGMTGEVYGYAPYTKLQKMFRSALFYILVLIGIGILGITALYM